jgi:hypothetical protein
MNRRPRAWAVAGTLGLVALLALVARAGLSSHASAARKGPFLSVFHDGSLTRVSGAAVTPASLALALGGLPPQELVRLREFLAQSTASAVRHAAPMLFDLDATEEDAGPATPDPLRKALPDLPALTAAANALGGPWGGPELSVQVGPACADGASQCAPLFVPASDRVDDPQLRHGRALAWALGNAALLRVPEGSRATLLASLQQAQTRASSTIALVFGAPRGTLDAAQLEPLREEAHQALVHLAPEAAQRPWLDALAAVRATWELPVRFDADQVLVVPRLSALARLQEFHAELARAGGVEL